MADAIPQDALAECMAIIGRTGAGKNFTARGLAERLLDGGARLCVLDPTGVWWGLRLDRDGKKPSPYPVVIFGGDKADVPINDQAGSVVAKIVAEHRTPCVIDVSDLTYGGRTRFAADFFDTLYRSNRRDPLTLIVDEADVFAPQRPMPDQNFMFSRLEQIVRRGRVRGFRPWLITQRPAELHKSVLSQAGTLIALKLTAPQDRKAIEGWVMGHADKGQGAEVLANLAGLPRGEGWLWYPAGDVLARRKFPAIKTFDSMRTPEPGEAEVTLAPLARERLGEIVGQIEALAEQAKADDPKALKAEIARLTRELAAKGAVAIPATDPREIEAADVEAARQEGYERGAGDADMSRRRGWDQGAKAVGEWATRALAEIVGVAQAQQANFAADMARALPPEAERGAAPNPVEIRRELPKSAAPRPATNGTGKLHAAASAMLTVLAQHAPARFSWQQTATLAGLKARGGHFNAGRKELVERALIEDTGGLIAISAHGRKVAGAVEIAPKSPAEVPTMWPTKLPSPAPEMLRYLASRGDEFTAREQLAAAINKEPRGGHWNGGLAVLRNNGLIEDRGGMLRAAALFLEERR